MNSDWLVMDFCDKGRCNLSPLFPLEILKHLPVGFIFMPLMDSQIKMESHKIQFKCRILRNIENGFTALEDNSYIIHFQDKKLMHLFTPKEEIVVTIENTKIEGNEIVANGSSVIYCILRNFMSNGLQFVDYSEKGKETFFWDYRGMITYKTFEKKDVFERDDILRISIKKLE